MSDTKIKFSKIKEAAFEKDNQMISFNASINSPEDIEITIVINDTSGGSTFYVNLMGKEFESFRDVIGYAFRMAPKVTGEI